MASSLLPNDDTLPYRLIEDDAEYLKNYLRACAAKTASSHPKETNSTQHNASNVQSIEQTDAMRSCIAAENIKQSALKIDFGLKFLLLELERANQSSKKDTETNDSSQKSNQQLKLELIDCKMRKSKWFNIERIGQDELYESFDRLLYELKNYTPYSVPFLTKVSKKDAPNYCTVIKTPMDLGTMFKKVRSFAYSSKEEFEADLNLIYDNCYAYNTDPNSPLRIYADCLRERWSVLMATVPNVEIRVKQDISSIVDFDFTDELDEFFATKSAVSAATKSESIPGMNLMENGTLDSQAIIDSYGEYLRVRATRIDAPFSEQPALVRSPSKMGFFSEAAECEFFCNSFPPACCLAAPLPLYNWCAQYSSSFNPFAKCKHAVSQLICNTINIHKLKHYRKKIGYFKSLGYDPFLVSNRNGSLSSEPNTPMSGDQQFFTGTKFLSSNNWVEFFSSGQPRNRAFDLKLDCIHILHKVIALVCANYGLESVSAYCFDFLGGYFYDKIFDFVQNLACIIENAMHLTPFLNLTQIVKLTLANCDFSAKDLLCYLKFDVEKYHAKLNRYERKFKSEIERAAKFVYCSGSRESTSSIVEAASICEDQFDLLQNKRMCLSNTPPPVSETQETAANADILFLTGQLGENDDLGLDLLGLRELGLAAGGVPWSLLQPTSLFTEENSPQTLSESAAIVAPDADREPLPLAATPSSYTFEAINEEKMIGLLKKYLIQ